MLRMISTFPCSGCGKPLVKCTKCHWPFCQTPGCERAKFIVCACGSRFLRAKTELPQKRRGGKWVYEK